MNYYQNMGGQYYPPQLQPQMQRLQQMEQQYPQFAQPQQPVYKQPTGLQGKSVDNIEVVKAMDIPLDGSISYFPIADGSAIVTKQLQQDGTSKTIIYKPTEIEGLDKMPKYITMEEFDEAVKKFDNVKDLKEEIKTIKRQIKDLSNDFKELSEDFKEVKD